MSGSGSGYHPAAPPLVHLVNSAKRVTGTNSGQFCVMLNVPENHDRIALCTCAFPKSHYLVRNGANTFVLGGVTYTVPPGNYAVNQFVTLVRSLLPEGTSLTYEKITAHLTLSAAGLSPLVFPDTSTLYNLFGAEYASSNAFATTWESSRVLEFQSAGLVYVTCSLVVDQSAHGSGYADLLGVIQVSQAPDYAWVAYVNPCPEQTARALLPTAGPTAAIFRLLDEDDQQLDLNGQEVVLQVRTWRAAPDLYMLVRQLGETWLQRERLLDERARTAAADAALAAPPLPLPKK